MFALLDREEYNMIFASFGTYFSALALAIGNYALKGNNQPTWHQQDITSLYSLSVCVTPFPLLNLVLRTPLHYLGLLIKTCPWIMDIRKDFQTNQINKTILSASFLIFSKNFLLISIFCQSFDLKCEEVGLKWKYWKPL